MSKNKLIKKQVTYNNDGHPIDCLFCRIHSRKESSRIVYEDNDFVVFKTIDPASCLHLLVTPREHIQNISILGGNKDIELIRNMVTIGNISLGQLGRDALYCFHCPPWNSIDHLHLHAIAKPLSYSGSIKYLTGTYWCKTADDVIDMIADRPSLRTNPIYINDKIITDKQDDNYKNSKL